jgi:uncharacterized spore protein YtfJ
MGDTESLPQGAIAALEKLLNARNVLGDPIERNGTTVIPVLNRGFGFAGGGGTGQPCAPERSDRRHAVDGIHAMNCIGFRARLARNRIGRRLRRLARR